MNRYEIMLYPKALRDIDEIYAYIALEKSAPENAQGQTDRIWDAIDSLDILDHVVRSMERRRNKDYESTDRKWITQVKREHNHSYK